MDAIYEKQIKKGNIMGKGLFHLSLEEKLKYFLVPARLYMIYRAFKEYKKGEKEIRILNTLAGHKKKQH